MNDIYSFYQLISKYQIEIPIIQRDYAQGRDNTKAADVREKLVRNIIKAVNDKEGRLSFDFVYGRIDGQKFIPFDGQQRLTTLFLFHKYVFEKCQSKSDCTHKGSCICKDILSRFSYATRQSSREFCEKLIQENVVPSDDKKISENIKNLSWFYPDWEKDPTVIGMLTMLDEIHNQSKEITNDSMQAVPGCGDEIQENTIFKTFAERLTSGCNCPITFHFVDMGEHKLSDETYVKMNARGKQLTPFENFKASLEQYLEEKLKPFKDKEKESLTEKEKEEKDKFDNLLRRFKGESNGEAFTGIDGTWLDLFWKVANKDNSEKELPDTLMMSFFNRHFMNIWRCWYAKNSKSEKERKPSSEEEMNSQTKCGEFNDRIQKEMPLYPTKDDFVSFDIYRFVMDECGIENCLTPIFNICDALYAKNKIEYDCQAVWCRNEVSKDKWDLFQRGAKDETYRSRTAFYALLKYYEDAESDRPTLAQWMRVVWNIIENYVEREESYIPALLLINDIAEKSFNISQLGDNYNGVAKDQVKEEIAKAEQILNGGDEWESKIIKAETFEFFKGAIRFLFTDGNGEINWEDFDTKWGNAQKYFDDKGVTEEYQKSAKLLRAMLSRIDISERWFGNHKEFWREMLLNRDYSAIHELLIGLLDVKEGCEDWIKDDHLLQELLTKYKSWHILKDWNDYSVLTRYSRREPNPRSPKEIVVLNHHRNNLLRNQCVSVDDDCIIANTNYLYGWNVNFKYKDHYFQWWGNPNNNELDVYLMESNGVYCEKKIQTTDKNTDEDKYFCFRVTEDMSTKDFLKKLECLIQQACAEKAGKDCYNDCSNKEDNNLQS